MIIEKSVGVSSGKLDTRSSSSVVRSANKRAPKSSGLSRHGKRSRKNVVVTKGIPKMNAKLRAELAALEAMPDSEIDTSDIPEMTDEDWKRPVYVGLMYRPGKRSVTIRLDADMVKWFKAQGKGWQTKMNWVLRLYFATHRKQGVKVGRP